MRTITISLMLVLVVVVCSLSISIAGYNYEEPLGPDIIDGLMPIPPRIAKQYGKTDKVRLVSNIAELLVTRKDHTARIKALEQLVKELQAQVAEIQDIALTDLAKVKKSFEEMVLAITTFDPNEVAK